MENDRQNAAGRSGKGAQNQISRRGEENETLGGYACSLLGAVPDDGTTAEITTDLFKFSVMSVKDHCIEEMVVTMPPEGTKD